MVWDMRVPIGASTDEVISTIREIVQDEVGVGFEVLERGEPNYTSTSSRVVQALAKNLKEVENKDLDLTYQWASSDAKFFRRAGTPTLQFGPSLLEGIHSFNEKVKVDDLVGAAKVYVATVIDFLNGQGE
jgi:succinyl-diaminopimelate desuccinylase